MRDSQHLHQAGMALATFKRYINSQLKNAGAWADLGERLSKSGRLDEACDAWDRALSLEPQRLDIRLALAKGLVQKTDLNQAVKVLSEAIQVDPGNFQIHELLRRILTRQGDWPGLYAEFERYSNAQPSERSEWEEGCLKLLFGRMPEGWEQYESRWSTPGETHRSKTHLRPLWNGEPFAGKTLLLRWEQGFGDNIMFVRYASQVKALGGRVLLEMIAPLADLLATCPGIDEVIKDGDPLPSFDLELPLLSLPRIFKTDLASIPADIPYLSVPSRVPHREGIDRILGATKDLTRVGLVWAGRPRHSSYPERSVPPAQMKPLSTLPGVVWHSFQMDTGGEQPFPRIIPMGSVLQGGFSDTAHALSGMDLVITVDTALAHLSGALGIPTFLLLHTFPDWRWLMGRDDSPWYPTMRLYRQPEPGDWPSVIKQVVADLSEGR